MTIQTLTRLSTIQNLFVALPEPIQACSRDYGFDFDEEEIGRELLTPVPANSVDQIMPEIGAEEFETLYSQFLA